MTWKLRDRALHKKLDEATDGEFSKKLIETVNLGFTDVTFVLGGSKFSMHLVGDDIEDVPGYNPLNWNEYPAVEPPKGVYMRVEGRVGSYFPLLPVPFYREAKACARFIEFRGKDRWIGMDDEPLHFTVQRFRPWKD